jgi:hypothetical protein
MRKVHLNSGVVQEHARQLLDDIHTVSNYIEAIEMFVVNPGPNCDSTVKEALIRVQKQLDKVKGYMGLMRVNSARLPIGGEADSDDTAFLEDVDSVLGLENGDLADVTEYTANYRRAYHGELIAYVQADSDIPAVVTISGEMLKTLAVTVPANN